MRGALIVYSTTLIKVTLSLIHLRLSNLGVSSIYVMLF
jgi:hypothetical protein